MGADLRLWGKGVALAAALMFAGPVWATAADYTLNYTGLYDSGQYYGINASSEPSPFVNEDNYTLTASGGNVSDIDDRFSVFVIYSNSAAVGIENSGNIDLTAMGASATDYAAFDASGIESYGPLTNSGRIRVSATASTINTGTQIFAAVHAFGIDAANAPVENSGEIIATASGAIATAPGTTQAQAEAQGIRVNGALNNSGTVTATATGGSATSSNDYASAQASGNATGIYSQGGIEEADLFNSGAITVTATGGTAVTSGEYASAGAHAHAQGINFESSTGSFTNNGALTVTATGGTATADRYYASAEVRAYGIDSDGDMTNTAAIDVRATGGTATSGTQVALAYAYAYGIYSSGDVDNSGDITATSQGGNAYGGLSHEDGDAYADAWGIYSSGDVSNSGAITVTATGGTATAASSEPYALGVGIMSMGGNVSNSGALTVTSTYGTGTGSDPFSTGFGDGHAGACGIFSAGGEVINSGTITVTAAAPEAYDTVAVGILSADDARLTNTGIIQSFGDRAYEVAILAGRTTLVGSYNLNLDGDPEVGSLFVADGAELSLNGATLTVSVVGEDAQMNTEYRIFETEGGTGTVSGAFGTVRALNPDLAVTYYDKNAGTLYDTVSFVYDPVGSPFLEGADLLRHAVSLTGSLVEQRLLGDFLQPFLAAAEPHQPRLYAAAGNVATDAVSGGPSATRNFFLTPYYTNIRKDASPVGYDSDAVGFVTGYEARNNDTLYGFHLGYSHNELDFTGTGFSSNEEDQDILTAGLHAMGSLGHWTWRGRLTGFYAWHNYDGLTGAGLNLAESADYDSLGANATLMGGYLIQLGRHLLLPEAGLDYFWLHQEGFTTNVSSAAWEEHNDSLDEHQVAAVASLRWLTRLQAGGDLVVTPSAAVGVRCLLTDDEIDVHQSVPGIAPVTVSSEQDDVAATASASLVFANQSRWSSELAYAGEYGDDTTAHSAWLRFNYRF
jgi:hypothetical protein